MFPQWSLFRWLIYVHKRGVFLKYFIIVNIASIDGLAGGHRAPTKTWGRLLWV